MLASIGLLGLGIIVLAVFIALHWLRVLPTIAAVSAFLSPVLIGDNGVIGHLLVRVIRWAVNTTGSLTAWAFGDAVVMILFIFTAIVFVHDLHPKHTTGRRTAWLGLVVGLLLVAGATGIPALAGAAGGIQNGTHSIVSNF